MCDFRDDHFVLDDQLGAHLWERLILNLSGVISYYITVQIKEMIVHSLGTNLLNVMHFFASLMVI